MAAETSPASPVRHRPRTMTVFVAAFVAGAAAAVGVNRALDVHLAQAKPQVECEPIFVALRSLPQGSPVTVWDVALRDWPKAMLPATALRVTDSFEGCLLKHALREGQPLLSVQLLKQEVSQPTPIEQPAGDVEEELVEEAFVPPVPRTEPVASLDDAPPAAGREPVAEPTGGSDLEQAGTDQAEAAEAAGASAASLGGPAVVADMSAAGAVPQGAGETAAAARTTDLVAGGDTAPVTVADAAAGSLAGRANEPPTESAADPEAESVATIADEPTLADPPAQPPASLPAASVPATAVVSETRSADPAGLPGDIDAAFDMPSRPPVDLSTMPSVMAREDATPPPVTDETAGGSTVRYLVVPERIARQADTSFTSPVAPEAEPAPARPEAPRQQQQQQRKPTASSQRQAGQQRQASQPQEGQPRSGQPRSGQPRQQPGQTPQGRPRQSAAGAQPPRSQSQQQVDEPGRQQPGERAWSGAFPNISAGLDAIGSWRGRVREAMAAEQPANEAPARQRR